MEEWEDAHPDSPIQKKAEEDEQFAEDMWRFRHPEEGGEKLTYEAILVEVPLRAGFTVSLNTLFRFYRWLGLRRRLQQKRQTIAQIQQEMSEDPNIAEEKIKQVGRVLFMTEAVNEKDGKLFANMVKIGQGDVKLRQRDDQLAMNQEIIGMDKRKLALLERKALAADEAAEQLRLLKDGGKLMPEEQRTAILDKMDEILGLKK